MTRRRFGRTFPGQRQISSSRDNAIASSVERLLDARGASRQVGTPFAETIEMQVTDVSGTTLTCIGHHDTPGTDEEFDVRLPPELIEADRGGVDYTYTDVNNRNADDGSSDEDQTMWPPYAAGDVLVVRADELDGEFVDTNRAGRAWAVEDA